MQDNGYEHAHWSPIQTPQQLVVVIVLAFVIPVVGIILLTQFVTLGHRPDPEALSSEAVAARIRPVARVEVGEGGGAAHAAKSGEEVYKTACSTCHAQGVAGAPKEGDKAAWSKRITVGLDGLVKNAINGIRAMPPRGGNPTLSDDEVARAVVYLANHSGANFKEPPAQKQAAAPPPAKAAPLSPAASAAPAVTAAAPAAPAAPPPAAAAPAAAGGGEAMQLLEKHACLACHAVDKRVVGPAYKEVAAKYAGDKDAMPKLMAKVKGGGVGVWGQVPMPPNPGVSDSELQTILKFILSQK